MQNNRYTRQKNQVILDRFKDTPITVVGVGAIGRSLTLGLAQIGAENIQLVDFDTVEETNICTQGYFEDDLGKFKVEAVSETCLKINKNIKIKPIVDRFSPKVVDKTPIIFSCVDSMHAREVIWNSTARNSEFFVDTRMAAEVARIITITTNKEYYKKTLFKDSEAYRDGCTQQSTFYCASIAAGLALAQFAKWTKSLFLDEDFTYNIFTNELIFNEKEKLDESETN